MQNLTGSETLAQAVPALLGKHLPVLLWDVNPAAVDPQAMARTIVQRVFERGTSDDRVAMPAYYGPGWVQEIAKTAPYLSDAAIKMVCEWLRLEKEALRCYQRKKTLPQAFNG